MSSYVSARLERQRWIVPMRVLLVLLLATGSTCGLEVSVCRDATYDLPSDRGTAICSGSGALPQGTGCPKANDVALRDCHEGLSTFNSSSSYCVAREDAKCQLVRDGVWGCVFPSLGCATSPTLPYKQAQLNCPTWEDVSLDEGSFLRRLDAFQSATEEGASVDDSWFIMETEPAALIACGRHPPVASSPPSVAKQTPSTSGTTASEPTLSPSSAPSPAEAQLLHPHLSLLAAAHQMSTPPASAQSIPGSITAEPTPTPTSSPISPPPTSVQPAITSPTLTPALVSLTPTPTPFFTTQIPTQAPSTPNTALTTANPSVTSAPSPPVPLPHPTPCPPRTEQSTSPPVTPCPSSPHVPAHSSPPAPLPPVASIPSTISQFQFSTQGEGPEQHVSALIGFVAPASQITATSSAIRIASTTQITATASEDHDVLGEGTVSTATAAATPTDSVELIAAVACGAAIAIAVAVFAVCKLRRFIRHDRLLRRKAGSTLATPVTVRSKFISAS